MQGEKSRLMIEAMYKLLGIEKECSGYKAQELLKMRFNNALFLLYAEYVGDVERGKKSMMVHCFRIRLGIKEEDFKDDTARKLLTKYNKKTDDRDREG